MKTLRMSGAVFGFALLAACATAEPPQIDRLEQARETVSQAAESPAVARHAPSTLREAQGLLGQAEQAWQQERDREQAQHYAYLAQQQAQVALNRARRAEAEQAALAMDEQRAQVQLQARERELAQARREAEEARQALAQAQTQLSELQPRQTERGLVVTLGEVLFPFDSAELRPRAERSLQQLARFLEAHPNQSVLIEGHTDAVGDPDYNVQLSQRRAEAVREALAGHGIEPDRIMARGLGEDYPVASNDTGEGRAQNRRVEVIIADEPPEPREPVAELQQ